MLKHFQGFINTFFRSLITDEEKISCYHCGEKSKKSLTVYIQFDGEIRPVCCHGCAAILKTIEELEMHDEYHSHKIQMPT